MKIKNYTPLFQTIYLFRFLFILSDIKIMVWNLKLYKWSFRCKNIKPTYIYFKF